MAQAGMRLGAALALLSTAAAAHGQTFFVDASAPEGGDGHSWATAFRRLQDAFDAANRGWGYGVLVRVAQGTYRAPPGPVLQPAFNLDPPAAVSSSTIMIQGSFFGLGSATPDARDFVRTPTVITADTLGDDAPEFQHRGDNRVSVLQLAGRAYRPTIRLDGLVIEGAEGTAVDLIGPAVARYGTLLFEDCVFRANRGVNGGALAIASEYPAPWIEIRRCRFEQNSAALGGAVYIGSSMPLFQDCVFTGNVASQDGGAVYSASTSSWFERCRFGGNGASRSGGAFFGGGALTSCLLVGNHAGYAGGAAFGSLIVGQCTIVDNDADWRGGGVRGESWLQLDDCLFSGNRARYGAQISGGDWLQILGTCQVDGGWRGIELDNPFPYDFGPYVDFGESFRNAAGADGDRSTWDDNDYRLSPRSPLLDMGTLASSWPQTDLDGNPRFVSAKQGCPARSDLGCYESQVTLCPSDINAEGGVTVDDFIAFIEAYAAGGWLADVTTDGGSPTPDGAVTIDDLLYFLARFEGGC